MENLILLYNFNLMILQTPSGVVCPGRKQTRAVPQLKNAFKYREEILANGGVQEVDVGITSELQ